MNESRLQSETGIRTLLQHLGVNHAGVDDTPKRVVKAFEEMTIGYSQDPKEILSKVFDVEHDAMVILKGIRFTSLCEHHMLPFVGEAVVAYIPEKGVVGLSKLARLVHCFAKRLQVQERLTNQVVNAIMAHLDCQGAGVIIKAHHACMGCRGVTQPDAEMVTSSLKGVFLEHEVRMEFLELAR